MEAVTGEAGRALMSLTADEKAEKRPYDGQAAPLTALTAVGGITSSGSGIRIKRLYLCVAAYGRHCGAPQGKG